MSADARLRARTSYASVVLDDAPAIVDRVPEHEPRHGEHAHDLTWLGLVRVRVRARVRVS